MSGNQYRVANHQLRLLEELAEELRLDPIWLLENAEAGKLPAMKLPRSGREKEWYFHFSGTCDAIAEMILTEYWTRETYPPIESNESEMEAASE